MLVAMTQPTDKIYFSSRRVGTDPHHHFFGYYDKSTWDLSGRYLLAHRVPVMTADITPRSTAEVGYFDLHADDQFHVVGETGAWNWQMGSQLQWLDKETGSLIYNVRTSDPSIQISVPPSSI